MFYFFSFTLFFFLIAFSLLFPKISLRGFYLYGKCGNCSTTSQRCLLVANWSNVYHLLSYIILVFKKWSYGLLWQKLSGEILGVLYIFFLIGVCFDFSQWRELMICYRHPVICRPPQQTWIFLPFKGKNVEDIAPFADAWQSCVKETYSISFLCFSFQC